MNSLLLLLVVIITIIVVVFCSQSRKKDGNEFFGEQNTIMNTLTSFMEQMDNVYALYITGTMSSDDFLTQRQNLMIAYNLIQVDYDNYLAKNPVKTGSYSYVSRRGMNAIQSLRQNIQNLLDNTVDEIGQPLNRNEMAYIYMVYQECINEDLCEYAVAFRWLVEADYVKDDTLKLAEIWQQYLEESSK